MYHRVVSSVAGLALALIVAGTAAFAASESGNPSFPSAPGFAAAITGTATVTGTAPVTGQQKIALALAAKFSDTLGVTVEDVMALRAETGWGNVFKILMVAQLSGLTPEEILAMRQDEKQGWGPIYQTLGVKPGKKENLGQTLKGAKTTPTATVAAPAPLGKKPAPQFTPTPKSNKPAVPPGQNKPKGSENGKGNGNGKGKD